MLIIYEHLLTAFFLGDQENAMKYMKKVESLLVDLEDFDDGI